MGRIIGVGYVGDIGAGKDNWHGSGRWLRWATEVQDNGHRLDKWCRIAHVGSVV